MAKILVNDGIEAIGKIMLEAAGFEVDMQTIPQEELMQKLNNYDAICVRSATKVRQALIDASPNLKVIARGGVGLDNIDVAYAKSKGVAVINTPGASSRSVAELAMGHLLGLARFLPQSNRAMPISGNTAFGELKKQYAKGAELEGKTLGVIGMGRIGQEMIKLGIGMGMQVLAYDPFVSSITVKFGNAQFQGEAAIASTDLDTLLAQSDAISVHVPSLDKALIDHQTLTKLKRGVILLNAARGGVIDEQALLDGLEQGIIGGAGLDVFENEPQPNIALLSHPKISLTPHIGASTIEAQDKVGVELAQQLIQLLK